MRHRNSGRKFSRTPAHRRAMFRNLATALLKHEQIETTLEKAKDLRGVVEKIITMAKVDSLYNRKKAFSYIEEKEVVRKLFSEIAPKYKERAGGYTRVIKASTRAGDAAEMAFIQLV